jgi:tetratricopeptide (TPR) repeat protein
MDNRQKAKNYFQLLLETTPNNNHLDVATIYSYLGRIARGDGLFDEALSHYFIALQVRSFIYTPY